MGAGQLDFERFINKLSEGGELIRAYFFDARISRDKEAERHDAQAGFFDYLTHVPRLELRIVDLDYNGEEGPEQKAVGVGLAVLMVEHALRGNFDRAVLVSADRDFVPACQAVKDAGAIMDRDIRGVRWGESLARCRRRRHPARQDASGRVLDFKVSAASHK